MTSLIAANYRYKNLLEMDTFWVALKFIFTHLVLAIIFLFLLFEEIDWALYSSRNNLNDEIVDNTSWNLTDFYSGFVKIYRKLV